MVPVRPGTVVVFSDVACPWAHVAVQRLHETRRRLGLDDRLRFDHHAFPLELINRRATPKIVLDAEMAVAGGLEPDAGWQMWQAPVWQWPVTTLLALEAVQAAKEQGLSASEELDRALRRALFGKSRCISLRTVVLDVAAECPGVDEAALAAALDDGRARRALMEDAATAATDEVQGSPHLFLPDGSDRFNPGLVVRWTGEHGRGVPVIDADDAAVYEELLTRAAAS